MTKLTLLLFLSGVSLQVPPGRVDFQTPPNHGGYHSWAFSPNGKLVAGGTGVVTSDGRAAHGGELIIWDARKGSILKNFGTHGDTVDFVAYSSDGKRVVSACSGVMNPAKESPPLVRLWDLRRAKIMREFHPGARAMLAPQISSDGSSLVWIGEKKISAGDRDYSKVGSLEVWNLVRGKRRWVLEDSDVKGFAISPDGETIVATYSHVEWTADEESDQLTGKVRGKGLVAWTVPKGEESWRLPLDKDWSFSPTHVRFLSGGKEFVTVEKGRVEFWNAADGSRSRTVALKELDSVGTVAVSSDGKRIANVDFMGRGLMMWDLSTGERKVHLTSEFGNSYGVMCFSGDLYRVAGVVPGKREEFGLRTPGILSLK